MAITYGKKKYRQNYVLYTILTTILLCTVFLSMVAALYTSAEADAYENLHEQTKQIKDDIILQLTSDRENLSTMASFAAKLYSDGESYNLMFDSFKPIGLIENIGILNPNNVFVTKAGSIDLSGKISFYEEAQRDAYISGRVKDLTRENHELIRSAVPIRVDGRTVGILYGVIPLDKIGDRYSRMAQELDAQLFVYGKDTGDLVIDTIHEDLGNISFLKDRKYNKNYSYEEMASTDKGFTSFASAYRDENMHLHYSAIDEIGWMIALARYDSQVFASVTRLTHSLLLTFFFMVFVIGAYVLTLMAGERRTNAIITCASDVRKTLLETSGSQDHITEALKQVCEFAQSRSAVFFNTDDETYFFISPTHRFGILTDEAVRKYFQAELFRYAAEFCAYGESAVNILCIKPDRHLNETNPNFYEFLKSHGIREVSLSATATGANHSTILAVINPGRSVPARRLAEKISACFSMALSNKNHLSRTERAATTDGLTGVSNRVAFNRDLMDFDTERALDFSCLYIDVNELHLRNNKYGHAAGDEMLLFIANSLKEVFFGHKVYRMGGDEFLVFCKNTPQDAVKKGIEIFQEQLKPRDYHVALGMSYRSQNTNTEEMVREAEIRMYEAKALFYQTKNEKRAAPEEEYVQVKTGIGEIDTMLSVLKEKYNGIYRVSLNTDKASRILMPAYLKYNENEEHFSELFHKYVAESVDPDDHRAVLSFMNYEAIRQRLAEGLTPHISYKKNTGESVVLSVYPLCDTAAFDTLWVFAKA